MKKWKISTNWFHKSTMLYSKSSKSWCRGETETWWISEQSSCVHLDRHWSKAVSKFKLFKLSKGRLANQPLKPLVLHILDETEQQIFVSEVEVFDNNPRLFLSKSTFSTSIYIKKMQSDKKYIWQNPSWENDNKQNKTLWISSIRATASQSSSLESVAAWKAIPRPWHKDDRIIKKAIHLWIKVLRSWNNQKCKLSKIDFVFWTKLCFSTS
jgi:hypothetical protein